MQILSYKHIVPTERREDYFAIPELDRDLSSVNQFIKLADLNVELTKDTGFIYVDGFTISQAESGVSRNDSTKYLVALTCGTSYIMHKWIGSFKNPEHIKVATTTSGTCSSGVQALTIANSWLDSGICEEVIIIGGERTSKETLRSFREIKIKLMCGDGFVYMKLGAGGNDIVDSRFDFVYNRNAFYFTRDNLNTLIPSYPVDYVKLHGTGTPSNTEAEVDLAALATPIAYKQDIGHTQGISSLLEVCMVLSDDSIKGTILAVANGAGGFFGACTINKH
jgi:hypothetical protein